MLYSKVLASFVKMAAGRGTNLKLPEQKEILTANRKFIVDYLEADDVIDELIQARVIGENAAQRVQLMGVSRAEKNRIIVEQLDTSGPGTPEMFCGILRKRERQVFIAEQLDWRNVSLQPYVINGNPKRISKDSFIIKEDLSYEGSSQTLFRF